MSGQEGRITNIVKPEHDIYVKGFNDTIARVNEVGINEDGTCQRIWSS